MRIELVANTCRNLEGQANVIEWTENMEESAYYPEMNRVHYEIILGVDQMHKILPEEQLHSSGHIRI